MPRYSYLCTTCGAFEDIRPMAAFAEPCACPVCGAMAPRELSAARLAGSSAPGAAPMSSKAAARHRSGCGCCTPPLRKGLRAEAVAAGAPGRGPAPASSSFLTRG